MLWNQICGMIMTNLILAGLPFSFDFWFVFSDLKQSTDGILSLKEEEMLTRS